MTMITVIMESLNNLFILKLIQIYLKAEIYVWKSLIKEIC